MRESDLSMSGILGDGLFNVSLSNIPRHASNKTYGYTLSYFRCFLFSLTQKMKIRKKKWKQYIWWGCIVPLIDWFWSPLGVVLQNSKLYTWHHHSPISIFEPLGPCFDTFYIFVFTWFYIIFVVLCWWF